MTRCPGCGRKVGTVAGVLRLHGSRSEPSCPWSGQRPEVNLPATAEQVGLVRRSLWEFSHARRDDVAHLQAMAVVGHDVLTFAQAVEPERLPPPIRRAAMAYALAYAAFEGDEG